MKLFRKLLESVKNRHQNNLESIRRSEFAFGYVHLFYNKSHNINPNRGGSYIESPDWKRKQKSNNKPLLLKIQQMFSVRVKS